MAKTPKSNPVRNSKTNNAPAKWSISSNGANAVVGQSGGPTGVINASLVGVIEEAHKHPEIENLYGAIHAVEGMAEDKFIDLKKFSADTLKEVAASPCSALGSSRKKPDEGILCQNS